MDEAKQISQNKTLKAILANIEHAHKMADENDSVKIVAVVSGSETDRDNWDKMLGQAKADLFNSDGSTIVHSFQEKIGAKRKEGNMLGTLLAYRYLKRKFTWKLVSYKDHVTLLGMLFGRGERMSPITQAQGDRKPGTVVTPANREIGGVKRGYTAIEEGLVYFTPVVKYLEKRGFRGVLDKWGDETEIPSVDLTDEPENNKEMAEYDVIKIISVLEITEELARQKEWVVFNGSGDMIAQLSRNERHILVEQLTELGIKPAEDGKFYAGVSLGPVAVSYNVLDIAEKVFAEEIKKTGVYFDLDPYFLMALAMDNDPEAWQKAVKADPELAKLAGEDGMVPDFFSKVQDIKSIFKEKYGRDLTLKTMDLGSCVYWADIGQHSAMREKFMALNDDGPCGIVSRKIAGIPGQRDENGNIIVNSEIAPGVAVHNSVIVNTKITGKGKVDSSVIIDSEFENLDLEKAFAVRSIRRGNTKLMATSGIFDSLGDDDLVLKEGMRHVSVFTEDGKVDLKVSETTNLRDKENTYNVPIYGNAISFDEAYNKMFGVSMQDLERRRLEWLKSSTK